MPYGKSSFKNIICKQNAEKAPDLPEFCAIQMETGAFILRQYAKNVPVERFLYFHARRAPVMLHIFGVLILMSPVWEKAWGMNGMPDARETIRGARAAVQRDWF